MIHKSASYGGFLAVAVLGIAYFYSDTDSSINKFGEAVSERLCDLLPRKEGLEHDGNTSTTPTTTGSTTLSKDSIFNLNAISGGAYDAKAAMDERYLRMKEVCHKYSDVLRPESIINLHMPHVDNFLFNEETNTVFCPLEAIGAKSFTQLFNRIQGASSASDPHRADGFKKNFPKSLRDTKRAIIVRHPMERLASVYRKLYAPSYNPVTNEEEGSDITFVDFIQLVVEGPVELAKFLEEHRVEGESIGVDTGMVDGEGQSKNWKPYWKHCGICHPLFQPHLILHLDHVEEDKKVLIEMMNSHEEGLEWASVIFPRAAAQPEFLEHLYSQLTKSEIMAIYDKYRADHELFGFTPDYFVSFGKDN